MDNFTVISKKIEAKGASTFEGLAEDSEISFLTSDTALFDKDNISLQDTNGIAVIFPKIDFSKYVLEEGDEESITQYINETIDELKTMPDIIQIIGFGGTNPYDLETYIRKFNPINGKNVYINALDRTDIYGRIYVNVEDVGKATNLTITVCVKFNDFKVINIPFGPPEGDINSVTVHFIDNTINATVEPVLAIGSALIKNNDSVKFVIGTK